MQKVSISIAADTTIFIESNTVLFTQQFLNVLVDTTDGYRTGISTQT